MPAPAGRAEAFKGPVALATNIDPHAPFHRCHPYLGINTLMLGRDLQRPCKLIGAEGPGVVKARQCALAHLNGAGMRGSGPIALVPMQTFVEL
jgi:hypothetical protein